MVGQLASIDNPSAGGLTVPGQSYLPGTVNTRRNVIALGGDGQAGATTVPGTDFCQRWGITVPSAGSGVTRYRFRIRNANVLQNTTVNGAIALAGIWVGTPNVGAENAWSGDFTAAPTQVAGPATIDPTANGSEYVSPWISNGLIAANRFVGVSIGVTCPGVQCNVGNGFPAWNWSGTGSAAAAGAAAVPGTTPHPFQAYLDVRMEYEFQGSNEIGFILGASLDNGYMSASTVALGAPIGHMGPDNVWHQQAALRLGHHSANSGVGGCGTVSNPAFSALSKIAWTRFFNPDTGGTSFANTPDYAIINLALNDILNQGVTLAQFQTATRGLIALCQSLGIFRIYLCTSTPGYNVGVLQSAWAGGQLNVVPANPITSISVSQGITSAGGNPILGPGASKGQPFGPSAWFTGLNVAACYLGDPLNPIGGPYIITAAAGGVGAPVVLTISGAPALPGGAVIGVPVLTFMEYLRQQFNQWVRGLPPGVQSILDFEQDAVFSGTYPMCTGKPQYYDNSGDAHPTNVGLYDVFATHFVNGLVGN